MEHLKIKYETKELTDNCSFEAFHENLGRSVTPFENLKT